MVVVAFNMTRELPRTLLSLSREMQRGVDGIAYEIIVVDNGSDPPVSLETYPLVTVIGIADAKASPASAVNEAILRCRYDLIGVLIDGARLASPGLIHHAVLGSRLHDRPVISSLGFHLGPDVQMQSIHDGYDQATEDSLLAGIAWESDPYRLFSISAFAGSSQNGWFMPIAESNALFLRRHMWDELGGYDERFVLPGGGFVNLDTYERACNLADVRLIVLLGEGTFHQVHGGAATNALVSPAAAFAEEYVSIRGRPFSIPETTPLYLGTMPAPALASVARSATMALEALPSNPDLTR